MTISESSIQAIPEIRASIDCPTRIHLGQDTVKVKVRVTYTGPGVSAQGGIAHETPSNPTPITIHLSNMTNSMDCRHGHIVLERWDVSRSAWDEIDGNPNHGFMLFDNPPIRVKIGDRGDNEFLTLREPGHSEVVTEETVYTGGSGESLLWYAAHTRELKAGDRFRIRYTSTTLDWWQWGDKRTDLKDVEVWLPCWEKGAVLEVPEGCCSDDSDSSRLKEGDNGGRPKLEVAEAVPVEFEIFT